MTMTARGRSALIFTAGLMMCFAGPMRATESDVRASDTATAADNTAVGKPIALGKFTRHRQSKKVASSKARKAAKSAKTDASKSDPKTADQSDAATVVEATPAMSTSVANANAQLSAEAQVESSAALAAKADNLLKGMGGKTDEDAAPKPTSEMQLVSADQLNDVDRAITADQPVATAAAATTDAPVIANSNSTMLDETSLIGKIFILFGGLLTLASAARMFIASGRRLSPLEARPVYGHIVSRRSIIDQCSVNSREST